MPNWTCPACRRGFARTNQSHECAPAMSLEEYFSTGPAFERPVFDAVMAFVETLGPVTVEPVSVGIFIKKQGSWLELRPMTKWVQLSFPLGRTLRDPRMTRKPVDGYHFVPLRRPEDVDATVESWLTESWLATD